MPARPTISDVTLRSGVSTATVSRVLSGSGAVRAGTRDRVLAAVTELDYRPSGVARALKRRETRTIGLVVTDIGNPFYPQIVRAAEVAAHECGYGLVLANGEDDPDRELSHLELLVERRVDGIVIASSRLTRHHSERLDEIGVPIVLVNDPIADSGRPAITADHRLGTRIATEHLLGLGHRRIGHVSAPPEHVASPLRRRGVADAMRGIGAPLVVEGDGGVEGGAAAVPALLAGGITAIVAYNDLTAIGALRGLREHGARVPHDVSLVGFDDIPMAAWTDPPLTTVRQDTEALGRWAVERIIGALAGEQAGPDRVLLEPALVIRGSTGPPRAP